MERGVRNRLVVFGSLWGLLLAAVPALVMAREVSLFLVVAVVCAVASGVAATLYAGLRASRDRKRRGLVAGVVTGLIQGLAGGAVGAIAVWVLMAVSMSGATLSNLMRPPVFIGSFFVALSVFVYALVGGVVLGPLFGALVNRAVQAPTGTEKGEG